MGWYTTQDTRVESMSCVELQRILETNTSGPIPCWSVKSGRCRIKLEAVKHMWWSCVVYMYESMYVGYTCICMKVFIQITFVDIVAFLMINRRRCFLIWGVFHRKSHINLRLTRTTTPKVLGHLLYWELHSELQIRNAISRQQHVLGCWNVAWLCVIRSFKITMSSKQKRWNIHIFLA